MNIAFVISSLSSGGAERVLSLLANEFIKKGYQVFIITICKDEIFYILDEKIQIIELNLCGISTNKLEALKRNFKIVKELRKCLKIIKPSCIISFMNSTNIYSILANFHLKSKLIISEHIDYRFVKLSFFWSIQQKIFYRFSDTLVSVSKGVDQNFKYLNIQKRTVISNPVDTSILVKSNCNDDSTDIEKYKDYMIAVGRLEHQKRFDVLIKSFSLLKDKSKKLLIFGNGSLKNDLLLLIQKLNLRHRVFLMGRVTNPYYVMKNALFLVLSSQYEGFGNVIIESMSCGTPVISFDCPSGPSEIIENEVNGVLVENQNVEQLAFQMQRLIDDKDLREKLSHEAIKVKEKYSIEKIANEWEDLIKKVIKNGLS